LHQQTLDTSTPSGRILFGISGVFSEFERAMIQDRVTAGLDRARASGNRLGRPRTTSFRIGRIRAALGRGAVVCETARLLRSARPRSHRCGGCRRPRLIRNPEPASRPEPVGVRITDSLPIRKKCASDARLLLSRNGLINQSIMIIAHQLH
jgi:hypothetical protein